MKIKHPSFKVNKVSVSMRNTRIRMLEEATRREGTTCPCCGQRCKIYKRKLNHQMARFLIWMVRSYEQNIRWIHVREFPLIQNRRGGGDYGKLLYWRLIQQKCNTKPQYKSTSGLWMPTFKGTQFVYKKICVPDAVYVYDNIPQYFSLNGIDIAEALNGVYDYEKLMAE